MAVVRNPARLHETFRVILFSHTENKKIGRVHNFFGAVNKRASYFLPDPFNQSQQIYIYVRNPSGTLGSRSTVDTGQPQHC